MVITTTIWLVVWNHGIWITFHMNWEWKIIPTHEVHHFQRGRLKPPTRIYRAIQMMLKYLKFTIWWEKLASFPWMRQADASHNRVWRTWSGRRAFQARPDFLGSLRWKIWENCWFMLIYEKYGDVLLVYWRVYGTSGNLLTIWWIFPDWKSTRNGWNGES